MAMVKNRDKTDTARRWGFVFAIARTWKTVEDKTIKNLVTHVPHNPTTTLTNKSFYFNRIWLFYVKCFDSFYRLNSLKFNRLAKPCISISYV
jgi:hypothetical protein